MKYFKETQDGLQATFTFKDFDAAFVFMTAVALVAVDHNHHPDRSNSYNTVSITLHTHDADQAVTQKDYDLASAIEDIYLLHAS
jgi:4a-hydroxytetrahydrobiopterin dehydratase